MLKHLSSFISNHVSLEQQELCLGQKTFPQPIFLEVNEIDWDEFYHKHPVLKMPYVVDETMNTTKTLG